MLGSEYHMTFYAGVTSYSNRGSDWSCQDHGIVYLREFNFRGSGARDYSLYTCFLSDMHLTMEDDMDFL